MERIYKRASSYGKENTGKELGMDYRILEKIESSRPYLVQTGIMITLHEMAWTAGNGLRKCSVDSIA